jgi:ribonuclease P protein component
MSQLLTLAWIPNDTEKIRIGFVVSKRISKRAVDRNYIKRLLGEAVRVFLPRLPAGLDIVVSARQKACAADLRMLEQDMLVLLLKAQLLESRPEVDTHC